MFDVNYLNRVTGLFPRPKDLEWLTYNNIFERKLLENRLHKLPAEFQALLAQFNSGPFVEFLEQLTGLGGLIPDPHYWGGGLHQIQTGGKLDIHADFNIHPKLKIDRRVNVLLYLNRGWKEEWGGQLELWDNAMTKKQVSIAPTFNRMVVFNNTDFSFHGHPEPLTCPPDVTRKSMALYYYTNGRPEEEKSPHHSVLYQRRPTDASTEEIEAMRKQRAKGRLN